MMRRHRKFLTNIPVHLVLYGRDHTACFFTEDDYRYYLYSLARLLKRHEVLLHAYVLMPNHVHLLMTALDVNGISNVMFEQGKQFQKYIAERYQQSSQLWQTNFKACYVEPNDYLMRTYYYIELNPVRVGMVDAPDEYQWSSHRYHGLNEFNPLIYEHDVFKLLSKETEIKNSIYRDMCGTCLPEMDIDEIESSYQYEIPLGSEAFKSRIDKMLKKMSDDNADNT